MKIETNLEERRNLIQHAFFYLPIILALFVKFFIITSKPYIRVYFQKGISKAKRAKQ